MRVRIFDVTAHGHKQFRAECELELCFPDPDDLADARDRLMANKQAWFGGGAAPAVVLERVS